MQVWQYWLNAQYEQYCEHTPEYVHVLLELSVYEGEQVLQANVLVDEQVTQLGTLQV